MTTTTASRRGSARTNVFFSCLPTIRNVGGHHVTRQCGRRPVRMASSYDVRYYLSIFRYISQWVIRAKNVYTHFHPSRYDDDIDDVIRPAKSQVSPVRALCTTLPFINTCSFRSTLFSLVFNSNSNYSFFFLFPYSLINLDDNRVFPRRYLETYWKKKKRNVNRSSLLIPIISCFIN